MSDQTQWPSSDTVQFMRLPAKQEPKAVVIAEPVIAQIISAQPNFPLAVENPLESTYQIRATANMGLGMFRFSSINSTAEELEAAFDVALDYMRVEDRVTYRKLAHTCLHNSQAAGNLLPSNPPGGPNERWTIGDYRDFDFPTFSFVVRAVREIKAGEEITTRHCDLEAPKETHISYPMLLDISGRLAKMLGNEELVASQNGKAEMFYQMRAWLTRKDIVRRAAALGNVLFRGLRAYVQRFGTN
ncbi:hypothetical protein DFH08DRAFT_936266 [Mycena albidolilacea]|uniref:Uncharacterized protein n=1 Tax=Mycena albidolilacea TaxID=1033008 RepID=A0AAD7A4V5_9AGAR|nr:hypothetical protein DFH08DRAFT_936266 [Mycena albidolilacea]